VPLAKEKMKHRVSLFSGRHGQTVAGKRRQDKKIKSKKICGERKST
jgi:hypothetical protein